MELRAEDQKLLGLADENARLAAALQSRLSDLQIQVDRLSALAEVEAEAKGQGR